MKKLFLVLMTLVLAVSALGLQVSRAQAADWIAYERSSFVQGKGIVYVFSAAGHNNKDVKGASIYVGSDFYDLFCWLTTDKEHIVCNAQGGLTQFAGQTAIIYLAGQIFYVTIPARGEPHESAAPPLVCADGMIPGADVMVDFGFGDGWEGPFFVEGSTLAEVQAQAETLYEEFLFKIVGELYCILEPT
ncbi:MAG: hypothetical protein IT314_06260 [Anaerolineales bacterium]|nr:hypothetical protein [Anaerolineales bacterium]